MRLTHVALAILVALIWGVNFVIIRFGLESLPPILFSAVRFWLTALPWVFFIKRPPFSRAFLVYALGTFTLQFSLLFTAMHLGASAGLSSLILQVQVFFTMAFAYVFLGERISRFQLLGLSVSCVGLSVIMGHLGGDMPLIAFVLVILAASVWGGGNIAAKQLSHENVMALIVWGGLLAAVVLSVMSLLLEREAWHWQTITEMSAKSGFAVFYIVYFSTFVGYGLWGLLLQKNRAGDVAQFTLLVPVFGMTASAVLLGEAMTWWKIVAAILIITGLLISRWRR